MEQNKKTVKQFLRHKPITDEVYAIAVYDQAGAFVGYFNNTNYNPYIIEVSPQYSAVRKFSRERADLISAQQNSSKEPLYTFTVTAQEV